MREIYVIDKEMGDVLEIVRYNPKKEVAYTLALEKVIDFNVENNYRAVGFKKRFNAFTKKKDIGTVYVEKLAGA